MHIERPEVATERKVVDWEAIQNDYRAGVLSTREIGAAHGVSHTAINKRAKAEGWDRDLTAKIRAKADALVAKREVSKEVSSERAATEQQVIEANAERIAQVKSAHRASSTRLLNLGMTLLAELEQQSADPSLLAELGELMRKPDDKGADKLNDLYQKIISTPSRVDSAKKVAETLRHAMGLERESYGLTDGTSGADRPGDISITF